MTLRITPAMLGTLLNGEFTEEACEAICRYYEEFQDDTHAPYIGDIKVLFAEMPSEGIEEDDMILEELNNGNVVVIR